MTKISSSVMFGLFLSLLSSTFDFAGAVIQQSSGLLQPDGNGVIFSDKVLWEKDKACFSAVRCATVCLKDPRCVYFTVSPTKAASMKDGCLMCRGHSGKPTVSVSKPGSRLYQLTNKSQTTTATTTANAKTHAATSTPTPTTNTAITITAATTTPTKTTIPTPTTTTTTPNPSTTTTTAATTINGTPTTSTTTIKTTATTTTPTTTTIATIPTNTAAETESQHTTTTRPPKRPPVTTKAVTTEQPITTTENHARSVTTDQQFTTEPPPVTTKTPPNRRKTPPVTFTTDSRSVTKTQPVTTETAPVTTSTLMDLFTTTTATTTTTTTATAAATAMTHVNTTTNTINATTAPNVAWLYSVCSAGQCPVAVANSECNSENACVCAAGYFFSLSTGSCLSSCSSQQALYIPYKGHVLTGVEHRGFPEYQFSLIACMAACNRRFNSCPTFNYCSGVRDGYCAINNRTRLEEGEWEVFDDPSSDCSHYQKYCK